MAKFLPCCCIPSSGQVRARFAVSLAGLVGYFSTHGVAPGITEQSMKIHLMESSVVNDNREKLVQKALANPDCTHMFFLDDDIAFPPDLLHQLYLWQVPIIGCNYRFRNPSGNFTAARTDGQPLQTTAATEGLEEALYMGFGAALIERAVFERLAEPWFTTEWSTSLQGFTTEDVPFFLRARAAGYRIFIDHTASKTLSHVGLWPYRWDDTPVEKPA